MRRGRVLVCALAVLAAACEMSQVDPDAPVTVSGTVESADGAPVASEPVVLLVEPTVSDVTFGLPFGLGSLGLACLAEDPPPPCDTRRRQHTDDAGRFSFTLRGRDTQGAFGEAARLTVSAAASPADGELRGPATTGAFVVRTEQVTLEPLPLVRAGLSLASEDGRGHVAWAWPAGTLRGTPGEPELVFEVAGRPVWVAPADRAGIDVRVLEDSRGAVSVGEHRRAEGTVDDLTYRSETIPYASGAGAPASRGLACRVVAGAERGVPLNPCPVTDGDLHTSATLDVPCPSDAPCTGPASVEIDLGGPRPVELVVVRGCVDTCPVEVSADGATWDVIGAVTGPFATVSRPSATPVRSVRVGVTDRGAVLTEVSVWDGPPAPGDLRRPEVATFESGIPPGTDAGRPTWLLVLAAVLLLTATLGLGVALGRRGRSDR